jgi:hypothetical protein
MQIKHHTPLPYSNGASSFSPDTSSLKYDLNIELYPLFAPHSTQKS